MSDDGECVATRRRGVGASGAFAFPRPWPGKIRPDRAALKPDKTLGEGLVCITAWRVHARQTSHTCSSVTEHSPHRRTHPPDVESGGGGEFMEAFFADKKIIEGHIGAIG